MTHIAFQPKGPRLELDTDYVVVGSGAGGAAVAVQLARGGATVAVVEAGPWRNPEDYPTSMYGALRDQFDNWGMSVARGKAIWPVIQARLVGGTTVINSAIVVRTPGDIFEEWKTNHGVGGEEMAKAVWEYQDQIENELHVVKVPTKSRGNSNRLAALASKRLNFKSHVISRNVKACSGSGQCLQGCKDDKKQSTNVTYIPETIRLGGTILSCAPVQKVTFQGRTATGVQGHFVHPHTRAKGAKFFVRARKAVIVAASATHSPALLERSGVKSKALGKYFRAHPGSGIVGCYRDKVDMSTGATQGWASTAFRTNPGYKLETLSLPLELVAGRISGAGTQLTQRLNEYGHMAMWIAAVRAETTGTVHNGLGNLPVVKYAMNHPDMHRLRDGAYQVAQMHFAAGAQAVIPGIIGLPFKIRADQVNLVRDAPLDPQRWTGILSHLFGGCVMGSNPETSVVNEKGKVHHYDRLYVADAAALPTTLGVNPQHTIMGLAKYRADQLLDLAA